VTAAEFAPPLRGGGGAPGGGAAAPAAAEAGAAAPPPALARPNPPGAAFDGYWADPAAKGPMHRIHAGQLFWEDGTVSVLAAEGTNQVSTVFEGNPCTGRLDAGPVGAGHAVRRLRWSFGGHWLRCATPPQAPSGEQGGALTGADAKEEASIVKALELSKRDSEGEAPEARAEAAASVARPVAPAPPALPAPPPRQHRGPAPPPTHPAPAKTRKPSWSRFCSGVAMLEPEELKRMTPILLRFFAVMRRAWSRPRRVPPHDILPLKRLFRAWARQMPTPAPAHAPAHAHAHAHAPAHAPSSAAWLDIREEAVSPSSSSSFMTAGS
jgi:hypothetical protein